MLEMDFRRRLGRTVAFAALLSISACSVGPDYRRPDVETPSAYKEDQGWTVAQPADLAPRGKWWQVYGDPDLDALEDAAVGNNQTVAQAEASYRAALTLVDAARANYFPTVSAGASATRSGSGNGRINNNFSTSSSGSISTNRQASLSVSWEVDLWGKVRRQVESQQAAADASAADLAGMALSVQASIASNYFQLRALDTQKQLLEDTIAAYQRTLDVTRNRYAGGVAARVDVAQAETQLKSTQVQSIDVGTSRAQFEHAIALLLGKPASSFSIPVKRW
jgi:NodT family efflux transporter outer membrane factor (OMF) lipoprotein